MFVQNVELQESSSDQEDTVKEELGTAMIVTTHTINPKKDWRRRRKKEETTRVSLELLEKLIRRIGHE